MLLAFDLTDRLTVKLISLGLVGWTTKNNPNQGSTISDLLIFSTSFWLIPTLIFVSTWFNCGDAQNKSSSVVPNSWAKLKLHLICRNVHFRPMLIFNFKAGGWDCCLPLVGVKFLSFEMNNSATAVRDSREIYLEGRGVTSNVWTYLAVVWYQRLESEAFIVHP